MCVYACVCICARVPMNESRLGPLLCLGIAAFLSVAVFAVVLLLPRF